MALLVWVVCSLEWDGNVKKLCGDLNLGEWTCISISFTIAVASDSRCSGGFSLGCALSELGPKGGGDLI